MKLKISISILLTFFCAGKFYPQKKPISIFAEAGSSNYQISIDMIGGDWNSNYYLQQGTQLNLGVEKQMNHLFSLQALFSYSSFHYSDNYYLQDVPKNARSLLYSVYSDLKLNLGSFFLLGGAGIIYQTQYEIPNPHADNFDEAFGEILFFRHFHIAEILGLGFDISLYNKLYLILESEINIRERTGGTILTGVMYSLN